MSSSLSQSFSSDMNTVHTYSLISSSSLRQTVYIQIVRAWPFSYNKHTLRCMENKLLCKNTDVVCYCCTIPVHEERPICMFFLISFLLFREITNAAKGKLCHISLPPMNYLRFILGSNIVKGRGMLVSVISRLDSDTKQHLYWTIYGTHRLVYQMKIRSPACLSGKVFLWTRGKATGWLCPLCCMFITQECVFRVWITQPACCCWHEV